MVTTSYIDILTPIGVHNHDYLKKNIKSWSLS